MELQSILTADYLDIVFDNRNKTYGGYELRKHYNQRAMKSITLVLSAALLLLGVHAFASGLKPKDVIAQIPIERTIEMQDLTPEVPDPPPMPPPPQPVPPAPSIAWTPPKIVRDIDVPDAPPTIEEIKDKVISTVTADGDPNGSDIAPIITGTGKGGPGFTAPTPRDPEIPFESVEQMPEFDGNIGEYLGRNIQYPQMARETQITGRVIIRFVVNEDGSVSGAKVLKGIGAGCEEEALRVINSMPKWKPGKNNGKAVKVFFTLPVKFAMNQ